MKQTIVGLLAMQVVKEGCICANVNNGVNTQSDCNTGNNQENAACCYGKTIADVNLMINGSPKLKSSLP